MKNIIKSIVLGIGWGFTVFVVYLTIGVFISSDFLAGIAQDDFIKYVICSAVIGLGFSGHGLCNICSCCIFCRLDTYSLRCNRRCNFTSLRSCVFTSGMALLCTLLQKAGSGNQQENS